MKIRNILTIPLSHCIQLYDMMVPGHNDIKLGDAYVVQRADGKYFRGQKLWQWCNNPLEAAFLDKGFITEFIAWKFKNKGIKFEIIKATDIKV